MGAPKIVLALDEKGAAAALTLSVAKFRRLVNAGSLPQARRVGDEERWWVADLEAIRTGEKAIPEDEGFTM
ncbi:hypothetical protein [Pacificoceanicola onchidii]|uniref:hypothetical protein n=1 Tax=Pacificoceanicola onchidii TaxID=2562685 RepID=UPI0010A385D1|nr:hypothetical protein [Pacificoceanicola onchidii]